MQQEKVITMHKRYNYNIRNAQGVVIRQEPIDPKTITVLMGENGERPQPPSVAYAQSLLGVCAWYGTTVDIEEVDVDADEA